MTLPLEDTGADWERWLADDGWARRIVEPQPQSPFAPGSRLVKLLRRQNGTPFFAELIPGGDQPSQVFADISVDAGVALEQQFAAQKYRLAVDDSFFGREGGLGQNPAVFSEKERQDFKDIYVQVFGIEQPQINRALAERHADNCLKAPEYRNVLLYDDAGNPSAIGSVVRAASVNLFYNIAVHPLRRRHGIGLQLMQRLHALAAPDLPCLLECSSEPWLQYFYEKAGFVSLARGEIWVYP